MKGTLLNTLTVAVGAGLGLLVGAGVPDQYRQVALSGIGLVVCGIGLKLFLKSENVLIVVAAIALGGVAGLALGIDAGLAGLADWTRQRVGGGGRFNEGLITASILFCVGPLTLIGCIKEGLDGDAELLYVKSAMDGFAAFFFAAALGRSGGYGVLMSAAVVLSLQGLLTLSARSLKRLAEEPDLLAETMAAGGVMLLAIGLGLLEIKRLSVASYLPALVLAPVFASIGRRFSKPKPTLTELHLEEMRTSPPPRDPWPSEAGERGSEP